LEEYSRAHNPRKWDNWTRLYAGYLMPIWLVSGALIVFFYVKTRPWGPKFTKFFKYLYRSTRDWLKSTVPIKKEVDVKELEREYKIKQEKV